MTHYHLFNREQDNYTGFDAYEASFESLEAAKQYAESQEPSFLRDFDIVIEQDGKLISICGGGWDYEKTAFTWHEGAKEK